MSELYFVFAIPVAVSLFFIVSLIIYKVEKKKMSSDVNEKDSAKLKNLRTAVSVSGIISAVLITILVLLAVLFYLFMKNM